jgi:hypothetical protein
MMAIYGAAARLRRWSRHARNDVAQSATHNSPQRKPGVSCCAAAKASALAPHNAALLRQLKHDVDRLAIPIALDLNLA